MAQEVVTTNRCVEWISGFEASRTDHQLSRPCKGQHPQDSDVHLARTERQFPDPFQLLEVIHSSRGRKRTRMKVEEALSVVRSEVTRTTTAIQRGQQEFESHSTSAPRQRLGRERSIVESTASLWMLSECSLVESVGSLWTNLDIIRTSGHVA